MAQVSADRPLVLIGAGNMGGAMLAGWLAAGTPPAAVTVVDPAPNPAIDALKTPGLTIVPAPEDVPASVIVIAVKPHLVAAAVESARICHRNDTLTVSVAAGISVAALSEIGPGPIVRAMPNTPASIGEGATVALAASAGEPDKALAGELLSAVGKVWWLEDEALMDAVTAVSGSGPAYVFHLVECMTEAGVAAGLPVELAGGIARQTVVGAGALLGRSSLDPGTLRSNVTSKGGTTAAALSVLRDSGSLQSLMNEAVSAAAKRSKELGS
ncbi:MAG: pyrroline-5-carboxylate reductase [Pseudomonadota bacterium]